ncbi:MAG: efflux RND transporter periplasmic adaptor subunit [Gallionellaceae bacterium]
MSKLQIKLILLAVVVAGVFGWVVTTQGPLAAIKVTTEKASVGDLSNTVFGIGSIEAKRSYNLAPTITSRVGRVLVDQGDRVKVGQLLAEMDPVDLDMRVLSSQQGAERAVYSIRVAEAQLAEAQSRSKMAQASYERVAGLRTGGYVSQEMLDAKLYEKNAARSAEVAATAALASAHLDQNRVQADASGVGKLRAQTRLISPINGIVTARLAEPGATVAAGQSVIQVVDPGSIWVEARIEQKQVGQVRIGQSVDIVLRSHPQQPIPGTVKRIELIGDTITEERVVNVAFAVPRVVASVGELAEVTIKLSQFEHVLSIPSAALKRHEQQDGVWFLKNKSVQFKAVKAGLSTMGGRTQILDGLSAGDEVIVYSQQALSPGLKVKVVKEIVRSKP